MGYDFGWRPYVSVAERRRKAEAEVRRMSKAGRAAAPVIIEGRGRAIAATFWGRAWCDHLEGHGDYANRLPRGRTYVRNGSVIDLQVEAGVVRALVSGSEIYRVEVKIKPLAAARFEAITRACTGKIGSVVELLSGRLSRAVMEVITDRAQGMFPSPREIDMSCSCPDWATMCKHVAAVLYGVGARLDARPELLFQLRQADHLALIGSAAAEGLLAAQQRTLGDEDLESLFGIELDKDDVASHAPPAGRGGSREEARPAAPEAKAPAVKRPAAKAAKAKMAAAKAKAKAAKEPVAKKPAAMAKSAKAKATKKPAAMAKAGKAKEPVAKKPATKAKAPAAKKPAGMVRAARAKPPVAKRPGGKAKAPAAKKQAAKAETPMAKRRPAVDESALAAALFRGLRFRL